MLYNNFEIKNNFLYIIGMDRGYLTKPRHVHSAFHAYQFEQEIMENSIMNYKHGLSKHPLYNVWQHMKDRCYNLKNKRYKDYGGRGIITCDKWKNDIKKFIEWGLANGWKKGLLIDRINNDGNYEPNNVRFVNAGLSTRNTRLLQSNNTSGYRGVCWHKQKNKWVARIMINNKAKHLGYFNRSKLAALRYNAEAFLLNDGRPMNFTTRST